jgi:hypothetical protein
LFIWLCKVYLIGPSFHGEECSEKAIPCVIARSEATKRSHKIASLRSQRLGIAFWLNKGYKREK